MFITHCNYYLLTYCWLISSHLQIPYNFAILPQLLLLLMLLLLLLSCGKRDIHEFTFCLSFIGFCCFIFSILFSNEINYEFLYVCMYGRVCVFTRVFIYFTGLCIHFDNFRLEVGAHRQNQPDSHTYPHSQSY